MKLPGFKLSTSTKDLLSNKLGSVFSAMRDKFEPSKIATSISKKESTIPLANKNVFDKYRVDPDTKMNKLNSILDFRLGAAPTSEIISGPASKILSQVYKLLVRIEETRTLRDELRRDKIEEEIIEDDKRNEEIVDAIKHIKPVVTTKRKKTTGPATLPKPPIPAGKPPAAPTPSPPAPSTPSTTTRIPPSTTPAKPSVPVNIPKVVIGAGVGLAPVLSKSESSSYDQLVYPKKEYRKTAPSKASLTKMSIDEVLKYQETMRKSGKYPSTAVGKYQIIEDTLKDAIKTLKLNKADAFDEKMQDRIYYEFLTGSKRLKLDAYLKGKVPDTSENLEAAQLEMAQEFASWPVPKDFIDSRGKLHKKGFSYYDRNGVDKASVTIEQSARALREERLLRTKKTPQSNENNLPTKTPMGDNLSEISKEYEGMFPRDEIATRTITIITDSPVYAASSPKSIPSPNKIDDEPSILG
jgi:hypothetical protein